MHGLETNGDRPVFRVLIVEDDEDSREMLSELVSLLGHSPVRAANAGEALQRVHEAEPEVALIDIGLPEVDGCEVARRVRASGASRVRLVALTGYSDGATREIAAAAGFDDFVVKPLLPETLEDLLRRVPSAG
jgi:two-component system, chemotaxis family, CheB/CheR fusion protein